MKKLLNQIEFLKSKSGVVWVHDDMPKGISVDEFKALPSHFKRNARKVGEFGPPLFDESWYQYNLRAFKKGLTWGVILLTPIFFQFALYSRWMKPGIYTKQ